MPYGGPTVLVFLIPSEPDGRNFARGGVPRKIKWLKCPRRLWNSATGGNTHIKRGYAVHAAKHRGMCLPIWWGNGCGGVAVGSYFSGLGLR